MMQKKGRPKSKVEEVEEEDTQKPSTDIRPVRILLPGLTNGMTIYQVGQIIVRPDPVLLEIAINGLYGQRFAEEITRDEASLEIERMLEDAEL
jgi:hypothetical protein